MKLFTRRPITLFARSAMTLAGAFLAFQILTVVTVVYFVLLPLAERSADDLAELIVLSAQTWVELPPETRHDFEQELARNHNLWLYPQSAPLARAEYPAPYQQLLENALAKRAGRPLPVVVTNWADPWFWTEIPFGGQLIRIGFPKERVGTRPIPALLLVLGGGVLLAFATALILARRITQPLERLSQATERVGKGETPELLPETGPRELAALARRFNHMAVQVRELLANRTTLLAGISHDLRTPLTRMRLAVEMLPADAAPQLTAQLQHDIEQMDVLIGALLDLSRELGSESRHSVDIAKLLHELAAEMQRSGAAVECRADTPCRVIAAPLALRRILVNLLDNAVRYGDGKPVEIHWQQDDAVRIGILDRGPGIPPHQCEAVFQPFYRLETSRSAATGGSGLGLAIARQLAQSNGWQVELLPRPEGGTEARLTLCGEDVAKNVSG